MIPSAHGGPVHSIHFQADMTAIEDNSMLACSGAHDGKLVINCVDTEFQSSSKISEWQGHSKLSIEASHCGVTAIGVDGELVVTGGADSSACIWKRLGNTGAKCEVEVLRRNDGVHGGAITAAVVSE